MNRLMRRDVRVIIPVKEDEKDTFVEVLNPKEHVIEYIKGIIVDNISEGMTSDDSRLMEYLIDNLTNIELAMPLEDLLETDLSNECKVLIYHIRNILEEIKQEVFMMMKMKMEKEKTNKLEQEVLAMMEESVSDGV